MNITRQPKYTSLLAAILTPLIPTVVHAGEWNCLAGAGGGLTPNFSHLPTAKRPTQFIAAAVCLHPLPEALPVFFKDMLYGLELTKHFGDDYISTFTSQIQDFNGNLGTIIEGGDSFHVLAHLGYNLTENSFATIGLDGTTTPISAKLSGTNGAVTTTVKHPNLTAFFSFGFPFAPVFGQEVSVIATYNVGSFFTESTPRSSDTIIQPSGNILFLMNIQAETPTP